MSTPVFRVTTYIVTGDEFANKTKNLVLRYELSRDYFVMIHGGADNSSAIDIDNVGVRVVGDPYGTGDLSQTDGNWLALQRFASDEGNVEITVTVVECLRANDTAGFRLVSVDAVTHVDFASSGQQTDTHTAGTAWSSASRCVPFGGYRGGGTSLTAAATESDTPSLGIRWWLSGTDTINWERDGYLGTSTEAAVSTVYVVEWGSEWDVQYVNIAGTGAAAYPDDATAYTAGSVARAFDPAKSWIWATGWTYGVGSTDTCLATFVLPGTGGPTVPSSPTTSVAAGLGAASAFDVDVYVLSHPSLAVEWDYKALGDATSPTAQVTIASPTGWEKQASADVVFSQTVAGQRFAEFRGRTSTTGAAVNMENAWSAYPVGTLALARRADQAPVATWAGWMQTVDLSGVALPAGQEPTFRVTQVEVEPGDWNTDTLDIALPNDLLANYFVMIEGARTDTDVGVGIASAAVRVTQDPFGTGDLGVSSAANVLRIERESSSGEWSGVITVVESLRSHDTAGFRLRGVKVCSGAVSGDHGVDTQLFAFDNGPDIVSLGRVMVLAGPRGGGATTAAATASDGAAIYTCGYMQDTSVLALTRYQFSTSYLDAYTATAYVVEWGSEWTMQVVRYTGDGPAAGAEVYFDTAIDTATTWVHTFVAAYEVGPDDGPQSVVVKPGAVGAAPSGSVDYLTVRCGTDESVHFVAYLLTHPSLSIDWGEPGMTTGDTTDSLTIASPSGESYGDTSGGHPYTLGYRLAQSWTWTDSSTAGATAVAVPWSRVTGPTTVTVERGQTGSALLEGWTEVVDLSGILSRTESTAWDDESGSWGPIQGLVVRDRWMDSMVVTATQEGGPVVGPVVPDSGNAGSLFAFAEGTPDTESASWVAGYDKSVVLDVVTGGGIGRAGFARRLNGQAASRTAGLNALTAFMHAGSPVTGTNYAGSIVYSTAFRKLIVGYVSSPTLVNTQSIPVNAHMQDTSNWTGGSFAVVDAVDGTEDSGLGMVEVPDGALLMFVPMQVGSSYDFDVYRSVDGGDSWTMVHRQLVKSVTGASLAGIGPVKMAASGDFVRVSYTFAALGTSVATLVSPDRGASWVELSSVSMVARGGGAPATPSDLNFTLCGAGDQSGTFLFQVQDDTAMLAHIASGLDDWQEYAALDINYGSVSVGAPHSVWTVRDPDRIWVLALTSNGTTSAELHAYVISTEDITDPDNWSEWGTIAVYDGVPDHIPYACHGVWAGEALVLFGLLDDAGSTGAGFAIMVAGQWDPIPWSHTTDETGSVSWLVDQLHQTVHTSWYSWMGRPDQAGGSLWTYTGTATLVTTASYQQMTDTTGVAGYYRAYDATPGPTDVFGNLHLWTQVTSARTGTSLAAEHMGLRHIVYGFGDGFDITIRMTTDGFLVYDNDGAATLYDGSGLLTSGVAVEWRVSTDGEGALEVRWRELTGGASSDDPWETTGALAPTLGNKSVVDTRVGILTAAGSAGTSTIRWGELVDSWGGAGQYAADKTYPTDMMGAPATRGGIHVANGIRVKWGGSGAFGSDGYTATIDYTRGVENLHLDSPRLFWESSTLAECGVVFQAGSATQSGARWEVDSVVLFGTTDRTCTLEFNDSDSWDAPAETIALTADLYADLTVVEVRGSSVRLQSASGVLPAPGECEGLFLRLVAAGAYSGQTFRIWQDPDAGTGWFQTDGTSLQSRAPVGTSAVIFGDRMAYRGDGFSRYRYVRAVFPDLSGVASSLGTATGTHRLGSIVLGSWVNLDVPLDWTFTDNAQPNVTEQRTKGGISWAHTEGPSQRTITGRIIGDVNEFRRKLRRLLGSHGDFSRAPAALLLNAKDRTPDSVVLVRWQSGSQQDEAAWYQDENGNWRTAGDADLVCVEVV